MKKISIIFPIIFVLNSSLFGQNLTLKEKAVEKFKEEQYKEAIEILEKAVLESPDDYEIYYYLGWYNHYLAYDSRPLKGYDFGHSEKIFFYLDKALKLNPNYGDAKYFYGAECSGNAFNAMRNYDLEKLKFFYKLAFDKGAYPSWLIELGKNLLNSCPPNSIFFAGGNADFDVCSYLQLHQNFRKDITVIPIGNLDRPWYVEFLKYGLKDGVKPITLSLTKNQIYDIHPFKWDTTTIDILIPQNDIEKFNLSNTYKLRWQVSPDLSSNRLHSKMSGENIKNRTYLSPQKAILLQIIEENYSMRPICFSNFCNPFFLNGLEKYLTNWGLISKLIPVDSKVYNIQNDYSEMEKLIRSENLQNYSDIIVNELPRISGLTFIYSETLYLLAKEYSIKNEKGKLKNLINFYDKYLRIGFNKETEKYYSDELEKLESNSDK